MIMLIMKKLKSKFLYTKFDSRYRYHNSTCKTNAYAREFDNFYAGLLHNYVVKKNVNRYNG